MPLNRSRPLARDSLEHLEAAFYKSGLQMYNAGAFNDAK